MTETKLSEFSDRTDTQIRNLWFSPRIVTELANKNRSRYGRPDQTDMLHTL